MTNLNNNKVEMRNYTPHTINLLDEDNKELFSIPPEGEVPRVEEKSEKIGSVGFAEVAPLYKVELGQVKNLPEPEEGVVLIVSKMVARASNRNDLIVPINLVRNEQGRIIGCRGFARV